MPYHFGERIECIMKIAEVTTDTETGFLAFSAVMVAGESIETDDDKRETCYLMEIEPMELCYVSYRTGEMTPVWAYDPNVIECERRRSKETAVRSFLESKDADMIDIEERTERFRSNEFYFMEPEEMDCIVGAGENKDFRRSGRMESARDILSKNDVFRRLLTKEDMGSYVDSRRAQEPRKRAKWN
ncbi:Uncharacterised protein [uncultured archaeon]|nr:Uncharacterised protein [uncultured archaeon]